MTRRMARGAAALCLALALAAPAAAADGPVAAIGRINNSAYAYCSGVLLAPRIVVTAAHCLWNRATRRWLRPEAIHFLAGFDRGDYVFHAVARAYRTGEGYDPARPIETLDHDWALLDLAGEAPAGIALLPAGPPPRQGEALATLGFARERPYRLERSTPCALRPVSPPGLFATTCRAPHGFSGGPLVGADGRLLGILVAGHEDATGGLVVPAAAWRAALGQMTGGAIDLRDGPQKSGMLPD